MGASCSAAEPREQFTVVNVDETARFNRQHVRLFRLSENILFALLALVATENPVSLCWMSEASTRLRCLAEAVAEEFCHQMNRQGFTGRSWLRVLRHLTWRVSCEQQLGVSTDVNVNSGVLRKLTTKPSEWEMITCTTQLKDGRIVSGGSHGIRIWDRASGECLMQLSSAGRAHMAKELHDGRILGCHGASLCVWDSLSGECMHQLTGIGKRVTCATQLMDGRVVYGAQGAGDWLFKDAPLGVWDTLRPEPLWLTGHYNQVWCVIQLRDGRIVSGGQDVYGLYPDSKQPLCVWENDTGECVMQLARAEYSAQYSWPQCVAELNDGRVVSGGMRGDAFIWDLATGECLIRLAGLEGYIQSVTQMLDGRLLMHDCHNHLGSASEQPGQLCVLDSATGECVMMMEGHTTRVNFLAQLLDGRIVSADNSGSIRIWDNMSGECLIQLQQNSDVACATQLTDGRLVSGGTCGLLYIWS